MALTQTRPYELDLYVQLEPGDPGYINPNELMYLVDHSTFDEPMRIPASNFGEAGSTIHYEKDTITGLSSATVSVTFEAAFTTTPVTVTFNVYRYVPSGASYVKEDVLYTVAGSNWVTTTGFTITIDSSESLTGGYVEYYFA